MANPQPNQFTKISNELYEAIMQTDFTKRQRNILDLVLRMSYGCRKKHAILRPSDFEIVGVGRNHVQQELKILINSNVLLVQGEIYQLNKDYDTWRVNLIRNFDPDKFEKVLHRNLAEIVPKTGTLIPETGTIEEDDLDEEFPNWEQESSQNGNTPVPETGIGTLDEPNSDAASGFPKDSIKESIKDSSTRDTLSVQDTEGENLRNHNSDFSFPRIFKIYEKHFALDGKISEIESDDLGDQFDTYGGEWLLEAMREAVRNNKRTLAYINGVLKGFKLRGGIGGASPPISGIDRTREFLDEQERLLEAKRARLKQRDGPKEVNCFANAT